MNDQPMNSAGQLRQEGTAALQRGEISTAVDLLTAAFDAAPEDVDIRLNLSSALILRKQFKKAIPLLESLTRDDPQKPVYWLNLGAAYLGNPILARDAEQRRAIEAFKEAIRLDPRTPNAAYNLGLVHRDRQEFAQALHWFEHAVATFPEDDDARFYMTQMKDKLAAEAGQPDPKGGGDGPAPSPSDGSGDG